MVKRVVLERLDHHNFYDVVKLSQTLTTEQQKCVAPNDYSIAEASMYPGISWPRAIYAEGKPVGFMMLELDNPEERKAGELPSHYLWRFMIGGDFQGKGYGKDVLDLIVEKCKNDGVKELKTSVELGGASPYEFYRAYGFKDTGVKLDCGELVLSLSLDN